MVAALLITLLINGVVFASLFSACFLASGRPWKKPQTAVVLWGVLFPLALPPALEIDTLIAVLVGGEDGRLGGVVGVVFLSMITAALLWRATGSVSVGGLVAAVGAISAWMWSGGSGVFRLGSGATIVWHAGVAAALIGWTISIRRAEPWRFEPLRCHGCGYDMRGLRNPVCPECGHALWRLAGRPTSSPVLESRRDRLAALRTTAEHVGSQGMSESANPGRDPDPGGTTSV